MKNVIVRSMVFFVGSALVGNAFATGYANEAAWRSAAGAFSIETFEGFGNLTEHSNFVSLNVTFGLLNDGIHYPHVMSTATTGGTSVSGVNVLVNRNQPILPGLGMIRMFPAAGNVLTAVGYWNTGGDDSSQLRLYDASGGLIEQFNTGSSGLIFNGIVNATGAAYAEFDEGGIGNGYFTLDDLQVVQRPIPAPSSALLLGIGGMVAMRRRRG